MAKKKVESWYWWIATNIASIPLYFVKGYVFTSVYYLVLLILAFWVWAEWKRKSRNKQYMTEGLVLGKFMPLHKGHLALIEFALQRCDLLHVLICTVQSEPINGNIRYNWLSELFANNTRVNLVLYQYDENDLPNTSVSSFEVSEKWALVIKEMLANVHTTIVAVAEVVNRLESSADSRIP